MSEAKRESATAATVEIDRVSEAKRESATLDKVEIDR
jgi:hypothetical protein